MVSSAFLLHILLRKPNTCYQLLHINDQKFAGINILHRVLKEWTFWKLLYIQYHKFLAQKNFVFQPNNIACYDKCNCRQREPA